MSLKTLKTSTTGLDFRLGDELDQLSRRARIVAAEGVAEHGRFHDSWINGHSREFSHTLATEGWVGMTWPIEHGGRGRPNIERVVMADEMISAGAPIAAGWVADRQMGPSIIRFGTADQQAEFLPGILTGEQTWCIGMSEPDAGSDLASVATTARRQGDEWIVNGQKIWTSMAHIADYCYLICRTSVDGPPHSGISEIIVPMDTPGIDVRRVADMVGNRHFCEVFFDDVRVPIENIVGVEGAAFTQTMSQLEHERGGIDRLVSNRPLFDDAVEQADRDDPLVRQQIASLETGYRLGRLMAYRHALGQAPAGYSTTIKCFCTEHERRVANFAANVLGSEALLDTAHSRAIMQSPSYTIMGGTSEVMRNILGERTLRLPREPRA